MAEGAYSRKRGWLMGVWGCRLSGARAEGGKVADGALACFVGAECAHRRCGTAVMWWRGGLCVVG